MRLQWDWSRGGPCSVHLSCRRPLHGRPSAPSAAVNMVHPMHTIVLTADSSTPVCLQLHTCLCPPCLSLQS